MTKTKIAKLEKELKETQVKLKDMTCDRDNSIWMYNEFSKIAITRGKTINILMPMVNKEMLTEALEELYDFRYDKTYSTEEITKKVKSTKEKNRQHEKENDFADLD